MTTLFYKALSQVEKIPVVNGWLSPAEEKEEILQYNTNSPRNSISSSPPSYENVIKEKRFLSSIWKRNYDDQKDELMYTADNKVDKTQVDHAITLIQLATEMKNSSTTQQNQMAIDLYLMGIDKLVNALPVENDPCIKVTLERKLMELKDRYQLNFISIQDFLGDEEPEKKERSQFSDLIVQAAVVGAIALKKSPIPDATSKVMNFTMNNLQKMDEKHQIRKRTWDLASLGISKAIEIDRQYEIHQMVTGAFYTGITAFVKAGLAYAETPTS